MHDPLAILFGSQARVKLLRFFLFNREERFVFEDLTKRARLVRRTARTEIGALERAGIVKRYSVALPKEDGRGKIRTDAYQTNPDFPYLPQFVEFFRATAPLNGDTILSHLKRAGKLDVVVMAGVFVHEPEQRVDLLIASRQPDADKIETAVKGIEADIGMVLRVTILETPDLQYRLGMYDKHTRDVFDFPHQVITDRIGLANELARPWTM